MALRRINHVVLSVRNLDDSARFYCDVLGLKRVARLLPTPQWQQEMLFLRSPLESSNHHDIALIGDAMLDPVGYGEPKRPGLFHLAFEVGTPDELEAIQHKLQETGCAAQSSKALNVAGTGDAWRITRMKQHRYAITLEHLATAKGEPSPHASLRFEVGNHDDIIEIIQKRLGRAEFSAETTTAMVLGLKLLSEVALENRGSPLFAELGPALGAFIRKLKQDA